jgi:hypothetical protein
VAAAATSAATYRRAALLIEAADEYAPAGRKPDDERCRVALMKAAAV